MPRLILGALHDSAKGIDMELTISTQHAHTRAAWASSDPLLTEYYETEWGLPIIDERGVFERLTLEAFQAGLSWLTVLRKREGFRRAFHHFDIDQIAEYGERDVERLLSDEEIIRNRRKIEATIENARAARRLRDSSEGDLARLVWAYRPERTPLPAREQEVPSSSAESTALARVLKAHGFRFVGPTTVYALMSAIGIVDLHLVSSSRRGCSGLWRSDGTQLSHPFDTGVSSAR